MTNFIRSSNTYRIFPNEAIPNIKKELPVGTYAVKQDDQGDFYVEDLDVFTISGKLYGDIQRRSDRVLNTFNQRPATTGALLCGEKGTGKTLLSKLISIDAAKQGYPTLVVSSPFFGEDFNKFMQLIAQPCVILFDEYEKVYKEEEAQNGLLTLLDGIYPSKKLFILTSNDSNRLVAPMINRPGRLFYKFAYEGLEEAFVREYAFDNLLDKSKVEQLVRLSYIVYPLNFDILKAVVEEMNRYGESAVEAIKWMNVRPNGKQETYDIRVTINGEAPHHVYGLTKNKDGVGFSGYVNPWESRNYEVAFTKEGYDDCVDGPEFSCDPQTTLESAKNGNLVFKQRVEFEGKTYDGVFVFKRQDRMSEAQKIESLMV